MMQSLARKEISRLGLRLSESVKRNCNTLGVWKRNFRRCVCLLVKYTKNTKIDFTKVFGIKARVNMSNKQKYRK